MLIDLKTMQISWSEKGFRERDYIIELSFYYKLNHLNNDSLRPDG